ncbi:MAG TPA: methyltransferase domain-containing protein [Candidatus Synoicihabitans sp.]|nr:methyltransferase domain-containing protein [Candidatus Synoicihabitans sp.]
MCVTVVPQDALTERLFHSTIHALELLGIYLGRTLGLYRALRDHGPLRSAELAALARVHERYAREWLEQQAVAGFLVVETEADEAEARRYRLPDDYVGVLANEDHPAHVAPFAHMIVGIAQAMPEVVKAYRQGTGVAYSRFGDDFRFGQAGINRPAFVADLTNEWLPAVNDLHAHLTRTKRPRIADVGCGAGWSTIALARAYPHAQVIGFDLDAASIADARRNAADAGVAVEFRCADAATIATSEPFDLLTMLETLHDLSHPRDVLAALRDALTTDGSLFIADERVAEEFTAPGDELERMMYGWSITHCLPSGMAESGASPIGTAIRPATVRRLAQEAGFGSCEILPIPNLLFRFYRLRRR